MYLPRTHLHLPSKSRLNIIFLTGVAAQKYKINVLSGLVSQHLRKAHTHPKPECGFTVMRQQFGILAPVLFSQIRVRWQIFRLVRFVTHALSKDVTMGAK